jgi:hypothetical protein
VVAVFADPAAGFAAGRREGFEKTFEFLAHPRIARRDLPLGQPLQEAAAGFTGATGRVVDATEQSVRD